MARNYLVSRALDDEDFILWVDVDVSSFPENILEVLLETGKCVWGHALTPSPAARHSGCVHEVLAGFCCVDLPSP
jgi:hypothetical protein